MGRAADPWEEAAAMDLPGAGGEGLGETSPGERGAAHGVAAGESPFPGQKNAIMRSAGFKGDSGGVRAGFPDGMVHCMIHCMIRLGAGFCR
jgi:hypothetical protein